MNSQINDKTINTDLLERIIAERGLKKKYIAKKLGLTPYGLSKKLNNETEFFASEIKVLCRVLNLTAAERDEIFLFNL